MSGKTGPFFLLACHHLGHNCACDEGENLMELLVEGVKSFVTEGDITVVLGGTVPPDEIAPLKEAGIAEVFGPGTPLERIITFIEDVKGSE